MGMEVERSALSVVDLEDAIVAAAAGRRAGTDDGEPSLGGDTTDAFKEEDFCRSIGPPSVGAQQSIEPPQQTPNAPSIARLIASTASPSPQTIAITALDMSATEEYERIAKSIPPPQPRPPPAELQAEVSMRKPPAPAPGGGSWGVLRQKVKKGSAKAKGKGKSKKKTMLERGYESAAEKARAAKDASDKEAAAATAAAERRKRRPPPRPAERKEREDPLRMEKMKAVAREAIGKRIAIKKQRRAARVERRVKELAALGGRLDPKDPFELQGKLKAELASLGRFDDSLARVTAQCAAFEASVRDWAANTAAAEESDEEEWQEVELPTITSEMILSIQAEVKEKGALLRQLGDPTVGIRRARLVESWRAAAAAGEEARFLQGGVNGGHDKHKVSGVWRHSGAASSIPCDYKYVGGEYVESKGLFAGAGGSMRPTNRTGDDPMEAYYRRKSKVTAKSSGYGARWRRGSDGSEGGEGISGAEEWEEGEEEEEEQEEGSDVDGESESEDSGDGSGSDDESVSQEDEDDEATDWWVGGVAPAKNSGFALLGREQCQTNATRRLNHQRQEARRRLEMELGGAGGEQGMLSLSVRAPLHARRGCVDGAAAPTPPREGSAHYPRRPTQFGVAVPDSPTKGPVSNGIGYGIMGHGLRLPGSVSPLPASASPPPVPSSIPRDHGLHHPQGHGSSSTMNFMLDATMSRLDHKLASMITPQGAHASLGTRAASDVYTAGNKTARRLELTTLPTGQVMCEPTQSQVHAFEVRNSFRAGKRSSIRATAATLTREGMQQRGRSSERRNSLPGALSPAALAQMQVRDTLEWGADGCMRARAAQHKAAAAAEGVGVGEPSAHTYLSPLPRNTYRRKSWGEDEEGHAMNASKSPSSRVRPPRPAAAASTRGAAVNQVKFKPFVPQAQSRLPLREGSFVLQSSDGATLKKSFPLMRDTLG